MSKYELQKLFFKKSKKLLMTSFFQSRSRSLASNFAGFGLEAKIEIETGLGLGKILRSRSWSRTSQSRLQPCKLHV